MFTLAQPRKPCDYCNNELETARKAAARKQLSRQLLVFSSILLAFVKVSHLCLDIELPFRDTDDDAYDGRIFFGPYTSAAKNQKNSSIAREMVSNSQKAEEGKNDDCVADDAKRDTRQTHFLKSCASYTFEESDEEKASSSMEDIPKLIKAEPMDIDTVGGPSSASGSSTRSSNEELIPNLMEIDGDENSKFDNDKAMMPPPPLPWGKLLKPTKVAEKKKEVVKKPEAKDWNARLTSMYGSVEVSR